VADRMRALRKVGVPYTDVQIENAREDLEAQDSDASPHITAFRKRWGGKVAMRKFDGQPDTVTEMDALIAYLQVLGAMVDFKTYQAKSANNLR
jgi:cytochrome c oxidase cbb3-type subunit 2